MFLKLKHTFDFNNLANSTKYIVYLDIKTM